MKLELLPVVFLFLLLLGLSSSLPFFFEEPEWMSEVYNYFGKFEPLYFIYFLITILFLLFWNVFFLIFSMYYLDCWIVTDQRTVHTELKGVFNRYVSSIYHHRIQDVSVDIGGILGTYFNFGDVQIQTAGKFRKFVFKMVPDPHETKTTILKAQKKFLKKKENSGKKNKNDF